MPAASVHKSVKAAAVGCSEVAGGAVDRAEVDGYVVGGQLLFKLRWVSNVIGNAEGMKLSCVMNLCDG